MVLFVYSDPSGLVLQICFVMEVKTSCASDCSSRTLRVEIDMQI